jgi:hypothetical protein
VRVRRTLVRDPPLAHDPGTPGEHEHLLHGGGMRLHRTELLDRVSAVRLAVGDAVASPFGRRS